MAKYLGIDLGTANVLIDVKGEGIVLNEPSVVAINTNNNDVVAVGKDAYLMVGRTPANIKAIRPLKDGVIADFDITEKMLQYLDRGYYNFTEKLRSLGAKIRRVSVDESGRESLVLNTIPSVTKLA